MLPCYVSHLSIRVTYVAMLCQSSLYIIIISLFALENNVHCLNRLQLVSTDYFNS